MIRLIIVFFGLLVSLLSYGQNKVVHGVVTTMNDMRVANIEVKAKKSGAGVLTDSLGMFSIVTNNRDVLSFISRGKVFSRKRVRIGSAYNKDTLVVKIRFVNTPENRNLVVGYGYVKESEMTFASSQMDRNDNFCSYSNIFDLIRGRMPGVQVVGTGNREPEIIIRGGSSINLSNCALYVVDGVVISSIGHISPCEVVSVSVLKDASSSMYGSRGSNGVVIIETVRGKR